MDIINLDKCAMLFIQENLRFETITPLMVFITHLGDNGRIWYILILILIINKQTRRTGKFAALSLALCAGIGEILKYIVMRPRPFIEISDLVTLTTQPASYSFPSLHTTCGFSIAFIAFYLESGKWRYALLFFAALMAISRPYVGVHYVGDVLAGFILAFIGSYFVVKFFRLNKNK